jgi:hypothetical protein
MEKFQEQQDPDDQDQVYEVEEPETRWELSTKISLCQWPI